MDAYARPSRARAGPRPAQRAGRLPVGLALYTVRSPERDRLQARLRAEGIATAVHYPRPIHLQPAMAEAGGKAGDLPVSERLSREVLSLPLYPELPLETVERIAALLR